MLGAAVALATLVVSFAGYLLPWDQLALWAVTVGSDIDGYGILFSGDVRFVLVGGAEVAPSTIVRWLIVHVVMAGPVLSLLIALAWRRHLPARAAGRRPISAQPPAVPAPGGG